MTVHSLSIVIPTYNGQSHLARLLPSVRQYAPRGTQVVVVDDASTDGTVRWLRAEHPWVQLVRLSRNRGFCGAVNAGVAHTFGDVVELLNNDTEVSAGWAETALTHFADPSVGSVAPLALFMDRPNVVESAGQEYYLCGWGKNRGYGQPLRDEFLVTREVFGPSASCGFYRRDALAKIGVMLPEYEAYYEDVDLSFRLRWAGYRCIYEPGSRVLHSESASYRQQRDRVVHLLARNEELVYWVNLRRHELFLGFLLHLAFLGVRLIRRTMHGQGYVYLAAKWDALCRWRWVFERRRALTGVAHTGAAPVDLHLNTRRVIRAGWKWMSPRRSA